MNLESVVRTGLPLRPAHVERIRIIDNHDFSNVRRKTKEDLGKIGIHVDDEYLDAGILGLKQYYAIALLDSHNMHAVSGRIDPFWHAHILHTKDYVDFCSAVVGSYMHHDPLNHEHTDDVAFVKHLYRFTLARYSECFTSVDPHFHPIAPSDADIVCTHGNDYVPEQEPLFLREVHAQAPAGWLH